MSAELGEDPVTEEKVTAWVALVKAAQRASRGWRPQPSRQDETLPRDQRHD